MNENARNPGRSRLIAVGLLTPVVLIVALGLIAYRLATKSVESFNWVTHTYAIIGEIDAAMAALVNAETAQRGYVITGLESYLEPYTNAPTETTNHIARLGELVVDDPNQRTNMQELLVLAGQRLARIEVVIGARKESGFEAAVSLGTNHQGKILMDKIRTVTTRMRAHELSLLASREAKYRSDAASVQFSALAFVVAALLVVLLVIMLLVRLHRYQQLVSVGAWTHQEDQGGKGTSFEIYLKDRVGAGTKGGVPPEALHQITHELEAWARKKARP